jgi:hypothetical protein
VSWPEDEVEAHPFEMSQVHEMLGIELPQILR